MPTEPAATSGGFLREINPVTRRQETAGVCAPRCVCPVTGRSRQRGPGRGREPGPPPARVPACPSLRRRVWSSHLAAARGPAGKLHHGVPQRGSGALQDNKAEPQHPPPGFTGMERGPQHAERADWHRDGAGGRLTCLVYSGPRRGQTPSNTVPGAFQSPAARNTRGTEGRRGAPCGSGTNRGGAPASFLVKTAK